VAASWSSPSAAFSPRRENRPRIVLRFPIAGSTVAPRRLYRTLPSSASRRCAMARREWCRGAAVHGWVRQLPGRDFHWQATTSLRTKINHLRDQPPLCWAHGKGSLNLAIGPPVDVPACNIRLDDSR
jgi:hypothetical protein